MQKRSELIFLDETDLDVWAKNHVVLAVNIYKDKKPNTYLIMAEENTPAWFEIDCFTLLDIRIPAGWKLSKITPDHYCLHPETLGDGIWNKYQGSVEDNQADDALKAVFKKTKAFHGIAS